MSTERFRIVLGWFAITIAFLVSSVFVAAFLTLSISAGNALGLSDANRSELLSIVSYAVVAGLLVDVVRMAAALLDTAAVKSRGKPWRSHDRDSFRRPRHTADA